MRAIRPYILVQTNPQSVDISQSIAISARLYDRDTNQPLVVRKIYLNIISMKDGHTIWPLEVVRKNDWKFDILIGTENMKRGHHYLVRVSNNRNLSPMGSTEFDVVKDNQVPIVIFPIPLPIREPTDDLDKRDIEKLIFRTQMDHRVCFPAFTLVKTSKGDKFIKDIKIDDDILTRYGYRKCIGFSKRKYQSTINKLVTNKGTLVATSDHPVWVQNHGWKEIHNITTKDTLQSINNEQLKVLNNINLGFRKSNNKPTIPTKFSVSSKVSNGIPMPIVPINLQPNFVPNQCEINTSSGNLILLNKRNIQTHKSDSKLSFKPSFSRISSITRKRTKKSLINTTRSYTKSFFTLFANFIMYWSSAMLRIWMSSFRLKTISTFITFENLLHHFSNILTNLSIIKFYFTNNMTVYDIEIVGEHEFYANDILVHNCPICKPYENQIFLPNESIPKIPLHFSCRCTYDVIFKDIFEASFHEIQEIYQAANAVKTLKVINVVNQIP